MTDPTPRPEGTKTTLPGDGAPTPFAVKPAARKSQALGDSAAEEIRRLDGEIADLETQIEWRLAERLKLARIVRATNGEG